MVIDVPSLIDALLLQGGQQVVEHRGPVPRPPAAGRAVAGAGQVGVRVGVVVDGQADLPEVVLAGGPVRRLADLLDGGQVTVSLRPLKVAVACPCAEGSPRTRDNGAAPGKRACGQ
jgi:hypothetical protein